MSIDKIIRPFQTPEPFTAKVLPPMSPAVRADGDEDLALIEWEGGASSTVITQEPPPGTYGLDFEEDTSRRVTETKTVTNPDDAEQRVEVERIKKMTLINKADGQELNLAVNWGE